VTARRDLSPAEPVAGAPSAISTAPSAISTAPSATSPASAAAGREGPSSDLRISPYRSGPLVVLVGAPGAGKTTVGELLAAELQAPWRDTDVDVAVLAGKSISDIFLDDGEEVFRRLEESAVATALAEHQGVLTVGGGAVLSATTRELLRPHCVVWLQVGLAAAAARVGLAKDRPVLTLSPRATLKYLLDQRHPLYAEVATFAVATDRRTPGEIVAELHAGLGTLEAPERRDDAPRPERVADDADEPRGNEELDRHSAHRVLEGPSDPGGPS
jgi:shikimate kinase